MVPSRPLAVLALALAGCAPEPADPGSGSSVPGPAGIRIARGEEPLPGHDLAERSAAAIARIAGELALPDGALDRLALHRTHAVGGGGIAVWTTTVLGLPVIDGEVRVVIDDAGRLVAWSAGAGAGAALGPGTPAIARDAAFGSATGQLAAATGERSGWTVYGDAGHARLVAVVAGDGLARAWQIEHTDADGSAWQLLLDADTGAELRRIRLDASHRYTVWAGDDLRPEPGPFVDTFPVPAGPPVLELGPPNQVEVEGLAATGDPWLPAGATETLGNHAHAYADLDASDRPSRPDVRAGTSGPDEFDWPADFDAPLDTAARIRPGLVQAFYVANWLHDRYADAGFDELAGNMQASNHGRGGAEGDPLQLQTLDAAANFLNARAVTFSDGNPSRLEIGPDRDWSISVDGMRLATVFVAQFGPQSFDLAAPPFDTGSLACAPLDPATAAAVAGRIAVVDLGACPFVDKAAAVEAAGAVGMVVVGTTGHLLGVVPVGIPAVGVSAGDGLALRAALGAGASELRIVRRAVDGALDSTVVSHEWGHGMFRRLTGGVATYEAAAVDEGNADVVALVTHLADRDALDAAYPIAAWFSHGVSNDAGTRGIRREAYSRDRAVDDLTFRHVSDGEPLPASSLPFGSNAEVHNAGEVWATAMFDGYLALQETGEADGRSFDEVARAMERTMVGGLGLAGFDPSFLGLRDATLLAAWLADPTDALVLADAFAGRGMGACAAGPNHFDPLLRGVVEDFSTLPAARVELSLELDATCDADARFDAGETGVAHVVVSNPTPRDLAGASVTLAGAGLSFPTGAVVAVPDLPPYGSVAVDVDLAVDATAPTGPTRITATVDGGVCGPAEAGVTLLLETDVASNAARTDDFAADDGAWTTPGARAPSWSRVTDPDTLETVWHAEGATRQDNRLVSPRLRVNGPLVVTLTHRHAFEAYGSFNVDGGVVELSVDGGPWVDVATVTDPGYGGVIGVQRNALSGREAFVGLNPSWPGYDDVVLDLGAGYVGHQVRVGLRLGTDTSVAAWGWDIAGVAVDGISNAPFPRVVPDTSVCP